MFLVVFTLRLYGISPLCMLDYFIHMVRRFSDTVDRHRRYFYSVIILKLNEIAAAPKFVVATD